MEGAKAVTFLRGVKNIIFSAHPNLVWNLPHSRNTAYLTFDDGPYPEITRKVLEILNHYHVSATFFLSGYQIDQFASQLKKLKYDGHTLGNHSYYHNPLFFKSKNALIQEISSTDSLIYKFFNQNVNLFRPPYGIWGPGLCNILNKMGKDLILWSLMSNDFKWPPKKCEEYLKKNLRTGDIIVFHDSPVGNHTVIDVLPKFIEFCLIENYEFRVF